MRAYDRATAALGPDFSVLQETPVEDIVRVNPLLGEAVSRLRAGAVIRQAGYDGEYGVIHLFEEGELDRLTRGALLFDAPLRRRARAKSKAPPNAAERRNSHLHRRPRLLAGPVSSPPSMPTKPERLRRRTDH
jgi:hypothetical protein